MEGYIAKCLTPLLQTERRENGSWNAALLCAMREMISGESEGQYLLCCGNSVQEEASRSSSIAIICSYFFFSFFLSFLPFV